jgi:hypothetical protein
MNINVAEKMRTLAFSNKEVKKLYQEAISEIEACAREGDLHCIIDNDETVRQMLIREGFFTMEVTDEQKPFSYKKLKVSW